MPTYGSQETQKDIEEGPPQQHATDRQMIEAPSVETETVSNRNETDDQIIPQIPLRLHQKTSFNVEDFKKEGIAQKDASEDSGDKKQVLQQSRLRFVLGCIVLTLAVIGGGFIGPSANMISNKNSWIKNQWSFGLRTVILIPMAVFEMVAKRDNYFSTLKQGLTRKNILFLFLTPIFQMIWSYGLVYGSERIVQSHAYVCNTLFCIFIVLIGYCLCLKPYKLELVGLVVVILGVSCLLSDKSAERMDGQTGSAWVYMVCIGCAFMASFFMLMNGLIVKALPIMFLLIVQSTLGFLFNGALNKIMSPADYVFFSADPVWGGFGLVQEDSMALFCFAISAGFLGNCGYVIALLFFSPVIVSASFLFEPFIGQMIGFWLSIDHFPGALTWIGTCAVVFGILSIQKADRQRKSDMLQAAETTTTTNKVTSTSQEVVDKNHPHPHTILEEAQQNFFLSKKTIRFNETK